eukprot:9503358-Pyramimonas_sp.AAC.1
MYAALRRDPYFEKDPPSINETCKLLRRMCAALAREHHFENGPPYICEAVSNFKPQEHYCEEVLGEPLAPPFRPASGCDGE